MSPTQIEENKEEETNKPLVINSGASAMYLPLTQDSGPLYYRRNQGNSEVWIAKFKNKIRRLILVEALVQQSHPETHTQLIATGTLVQHKEHLVDWYITYPRYTTQLRPERNPRKTPISAADNFSHTVTAGSIIRTADISRNYLYLPINTPLVELPVAVR